mgnify:CR=1 FL=1
MVEPEIRGLPGREAALAVNRWCARQMTYETTDTRSMNPVTCYFCGLGRCGEGVHLRRDGPAVRGDSRPADLCALVEPLR